MVADGMWFQILFQKASAFWEIGFYHSRFKLQFLNTSVTWATFFAYISWHLLSKFFYIHAYWKDSHYNRYYKFIYTIIRIPEFYILFSVSWIGGFGWGNMCIPFHHPNMSCNRFFKTKAMRPTENITILRKLERGSEYGVNESTNRFNEKAENNYVDDLWLILYRAVVMCPVLVDSIRNKAFQLYSNLC